MSEPLIQVSNLVKTYETPAGPLNVLRGIDMEIDRGSFIALVGPAGGGKTTFLNMITGIDKPTTGEVIVDGIDVSNSSEKKLTRWRGTEYRYRISILPAAAHPYRAGKRDDADGFLQYLRSQRTA